MRSSLPVAATVHSALRWPTELEKCSLRPFLNSQAICRNRVFLNPLSCSQTLCFSCCRAGTPQVVPKPYRQVAPNVFESFQTLQVVPKPSQLLTLYGCWCKFHSGTGPSREHTAALNVLILRVQAPKYEAHNPKP